MAKKSSNQRLKAYFFLLINTLCWGAALVIVKPAFDVTTPFRFLLYRYLLALPLSLPFIWHYRKHFTLSTLQTITKLELIGTTLALGLLYAGLALTSSIEASFLTTTTPIFIVLAGVLFLKERQEKRESLGLFLAFIGTVFLTITPTITQDFSLSSASLTGNILIIGQNVATAWYFILAKRSYKHLPKLFVTSVSYAIGILTFGALSAWEAGSLSQLYQAVQLDLQAISVVWASFYMAVFGSIIGLTAYIKGQDGIEASEASIFWYLQPFVFVPLGFILLNETVTLSQIMAMGLVLLGILIAEKRR